MGTEQFVNAIFIPSFLQREFSMDFDLLFRGPFPDVAHLASVAPDWHYAVLRTGALRRRTFPSYIEPTARFAINGI
jgi:hypothetical protein